MQFVLRKLIVNGSVLSRPMPRGFPTLRSLQPPAVEDATGVERFSGACDRFRERHAAGGPFVDEPFLGPV